MKNYYEHTPSELLTLLMDRELDSQGEEILFNTLANNTELQNELQQMIAIRETVRNDTEAFSPPAATTSALFNKLGYNPVTAFLPQKNSFWNALYSRKVSVGIATVLILFFSSFLIMNHYNSNKTNETDLANNVAPFSNVLAVNDTYVNGQNTETKINKESNIKAPIITSSENNKTNISAVNENSISQSSTHSNNNEFRTMNTLTTASNLNLNNNVQIANHSAMNMFSNVMPVYHLNHNYNEQNDFNQYWNIMVTGFYSNSMSQTKKVGQLDNSSISNSTSFAISLMRATSPQWALGIQFGNDEFNLYGTDESEVNLRSETPMVFWFGASALHNLEYFKLYGFTPFIQTTVGGSTRGMLARGSVGLKYDLHRNFSLTTSYDAGLLMYNVKSDTYTSHKSGLSAGINIKF